MGHIDVAHVGHVVPTGRMLLDDALFRIGEGTTAALVGPNGAGKTTLIRIIAGDLSPQSGTVAVSGGLGVMRQFVGGIRAAGSAGEQGEDMAASPGAGATGGDGVPVAVDADAQAPGQPDTGRVPHLGRLVVALHHRQLGGVEPGGG